MSTVIWITIAVAVVIIWAIGVVDIFRRHLGTKKTVAWLLIVLIIPFLGTLLYWMLREPDADALQRAADAQRDQREQARRRPSDSTGFGV